MATNTYTALRTTTLTSVASSVTLDLTGITGYTDLVVVSSVNSARAAQYDSLAVRFNSDTANNYCYTYMQGNTSNGSTVISGNVANQSNIFIGNIVSSSVSNNFSVNIMHIMNYANTTTYKTVLSQGGAIIDATNNDLEAVVGSWRATPAAITSIIIRSETGSNFNIGSSFTVYGITAGTSLAAKATGGTVYYDVENGYAYHKFTSSGTFTPTQSLTVDALVIAGGGGGGSTYGQAAGGGAGGLVYLPSQSVTATGYTVTVGSPGSTNSTPNGPSGTNGTGSQFGVLTAADGGGGGASYRNNGTGGQNGSAGGSGGGGGAYSNGSGGGAGGAATSGQGYAGGAGRGPSDWGGGGGGGAGGAGQDAPGNGVNRGGNGGVGSAAYSRWGEITSSGEKVSSTYYFAGGGGGVGDGVAGYGNGAANTGGGGGGQANGNSGIVIIRYAL